jgi:hypothetical protein
MCALVSMRACAAQACESGKVLSINGRTFPPQHIRAVSAGRGLGRGNEIFALIVNERLDARV